MKKPIIWITWENQRRNEGISLALGAKLFKMLYPQRGLYRYFKLTYRTLKTIIKYNPKIICAQNPSIVLASLMIILKKITGKIIIIDAHNAGISPFDGKIWLCNKLSKYIQKNADITIVTNNALKQHVESNDGRACVLFDRIPAVNKDINKANNLQKDKWKIVFICTFSNDEPYMEVIKCSKLLSKDVQIYVTGNHKGMFDHSKLPSQVKLLGFIPDDDYWELLASSHIIIDITTRENCLVCGAYEGIALGKPLILSDTNATKELFRMGCVYVQPTAESIKNGIEECIGNYQKYVYEVGELRNILENEWVIKVNNIKEAVKMIIDNKVAN